MQDVAARALWALAKDERRCLRAQQEQGGLLGGCGAEPLAAALLQLTEAAGEQEVRRSGGGSEAEGAEGHPAYTLDPLAQGLAVLVASRSLLLQAQLRDREDQVDAAAAAASPDALSPFAAAASATAAEEDLAAAAAAADICHAEEAESLLKALAAVHPGVEQMVEERRELPARSSTCCIS